MSSTVINTNVMSLNSQYNLKRSDNALAQSLERLSSGLRINSAKDDAAGLAISDRMTAMIRGNAQSIKNANDGISMVQTAEGALSTITNDLQRMRELAVQSSNDSNTALDRVTLNNEFQQLIRAIGRVANTTDFNTRKLLDGTLQSQVFQTGSNQGNTIATTSVDARNTQLGGRQIVGINGITEAQMKNGVEEIKGSFTVSISQVRGENIMPLELKIDLSDPIFNPDVNAEGTKPGTTGLKTLEDVTRVVNNAIQMAVKGTEPPGTFSFDNGSMSEADARLKLAQANVSAAIITKNNGESNVILRGAFDSQFELKINESLEIALKSGKTVGDVANHSTPLRGVGTPSDWVSKFEVAGDTSAKFNATTTTFAGDVRLSFDLGGQAQTMEVNSNGGDLATLVDRLNNSSSRPEGVYFSVDASVPADLKLVISDGQGRLVDNVAIIEDVNGAPAAVATEDSIAVANNESTATIAGSALEPLFPIADISNPTGTETTLGGGFGGTWTAGELNSMKITIGGVTRELDLSATTGVVGIDTALQAAFGGGPVGVTAAVDSATGDLLITDTEGRSISGISLEMYSTAIVSNLSPTFNDGVGENISGFAVTIDGQRINADVSGVKSMEELKTTIESAIHNFIPEGSSIKPFENIRVDFGYIPHTNPGDFISDPSSLQIRIVDDEFRRIEGVQLTGPDVVTLFDKEPYDFSISNLGTANPYASEQVNLTQINVTTHFDSVIALNIIDGALNQISDLRSELGAVQKLFESAIDNLGIYNVNLSAARSRILDTDFAEETAALTRAQILQQAGISTLSQANAGPQAILALLQ